MSYAPTTDLLALLRQTSGGVRSVRMPGLDYIIAGLARANVFSLWVGQTPPIVNLATTVWLQPASPSSWALEGSILLYSPVAGGFVPATPALWSALFVALASGYVFQSVGAGAGVVSPTTTFLAIQRANPAATALTLPSVVTRAGKSLQISDWSTGVTVHTITATPAGSETIMQKSAFEFVSTPDQLAGVTLYPSTDLSGWAIAP